MYTSIAQHNPNNNHISKSIRKYTALDNYNTNEKAKSFTSKKNKK